MSNPRWLRHYFDTLDAALLAKDRNGDTIVKVTMQTGGHWYGFLASGHGIRLPYYDKATESLWEDAQPALPGFGDAVEDAHQAKEQGAGDELTARMREPARDISTDAGRMEREAPLFFGKGDNPILF